MNTQELEKSFLRNLRDLMDLKKDTDYEETEASIRKNAEFRSANAWTLVFAIFIASVGLNTNSTAVIIGAMLISPLMGAIVGAGYALGVYDFELLFRSGRNLAIAVGISVLTSTIFFLVSPFGEASNELLARTSPTFYDVLIATFGGAAGIVASSRKEKGNAIPGVAIATALMPPLCTVGYGIAHANLSFILGAFYLFIINSVFICLTSYIFVRYLEFPKIKFAFPDQQQKIDRWIMGIATVVTIPSLVLAWLLLQESTFTTRANRFIDRELKFKNTFLVERQVEHSFNKQSIRVTLMGDQISKEKLSAVKANLDLYDLSGTKLVVRQVSIDERINERMAQSQGQSQGYQRTILNLEQKIKGYESKEKLGNDLNSEVLLLQPRISLVMIEGGRVAVVWKSHPKADERTAVEKYLRQRLENEKLTIQHTQKI